MANIYVGNLPYSTTSEDLKGLFEPFGEVKYISVVVDRTTGRSKGFAFVDMPTADSHKAIEALNQSELMGRKLVVNEAKPRLTDGFQSSSRPPHPYSRSR